MVDAFAERIGMSVEDALDTIYNRLQREISDIRDRDAQTILNDFLIADKKVKTPKSRKGLNQLAELLEIPTLINDEIEKTNIDNFDEQRGVIDNDLSKVGISGKFSGITKQLENKNKEKKEEIFKEIDNLIEGITSSTKSAKHKRDSIRLITDSVDVNIKEKIDRGISGILKEEGESSIELTIEFRNRIFSADTITEINIIEKEISRRQSEFINLGVTKSKQMMNLRSLERAIQQRKDDIK